MLTFSVDLGIAAYHVLGYDALFPHFIGLDYPLTFLYGPLFYLYVRSIRKTTPLRKTDLLHFTPFAVALIAMSPFFGLSGAEKLAAIQGQAHGPLFQALSIGNPLKIVHALAYLGLTLWLFSRTSDTSFFQSRTSQSTWIRNLLISTLLLTGIAIVVFVTRVDTAPALGVSPEGTLDHLTLLCTTLFVYAVGYLGLRTPSVVSSAPAESADANPEDAASSSTATYEKSGMSEERAEQYATELVELMEREALYRNGDLTLQHLADALSITPHNLTEVLNAHLDQTFHAFVNSYRVEEVKARLTDPECQHLTVLAIGLDAGFNSKSTFYSVFKRHTGMTPTQYAEQATAKTAGVVD